MEVDCRTQLSFRTFRKSFFLAELGVRLKKGPGPKTRPIHALFVDNWLSTNTKRGFMVDDLAFSKPTSSIELFFLVKIFSFSRSVDFFLGDEISLGLG